MRILFVVVALWSALAGAADISNPMNLMFAGDRNEKLIDVIDLRKEQVVHRFATQYRVDDLIATPYAPLLFYTNIDAKVILAYNLESQELIKTAELPITPRHVVLDTTGTKIGISDSMAGGFVLFSAYTQSITFTLAEFPPTTDVLFDPNDVDIYYSNNRKGSIGIMDVNLQKTFEMQLVEDTTAMFSSPSRSLDGRYVYVANRNTGEVHSLNAYSKVIYKTFHIGDAPARPYTTPEGVFLYLMDQAGRFVSVEQNRFERYADVSLDRGVDLVAVGRFDRMNLFASTDSRHYYRYDNVKNKVVESGLLSGTPIDVQGSVDGRIAYVPFGDKPEIAAIDLERGKITTIAATESGVGAFAVGLSNNACH